MGGRIESQQVMFFFLIYHGLHLNRKKAPKVTPVATKSRSGLNKYHMFSDCFEVNPILCLSDCLSVRRLIGQSVSQSISRVCAHLCVCLFVCLSVSLCSSQRGLRAASSRGPCFGTRSGTQVVSGQVRRQ
jgi:hypothetical protein